LLKIKNFYQTAQLVYIRAIGPGPAGARREGKARRNRPVEADSVPGAPVQPRHPQRLEETITMRLLLAEDDVPLGNGIRAGLSLDGFSMEWVTDGVSADRTLRRGAFDLVVLDLGLPVRSGLEVLTSMRARGDHTPVLILTAWDSIEDRVNGLETGGDDYLTKPFDLDELSARIKALYRRSQGFSPTRLEHNGLSLDKGAHRVTLEGRPIGLSPREFVILQVLLENVGAVLSRCALEQSLYGWDMDVESNTVEVHVHFLRKKLGDGLIRTVRGVGYTIDKPGP
jgi:two-component system response regulator QseB